MDYVTTNSETGNYLKNQNGTAGRDCYCGPWISHWKNYTGSDRATVCIVAGCMNQPTLGGHVEFLKVENLKGLSYIAPMCVEHNNARGSEFMSRPGIRLARGNVAETCWK